MTLVPRCRKASPSLPISNSVQHGMQTLVGYPRCNAVPRVSVLQEGAGGLSRGPDMHTLGLSLRHIPYPEGAEAQEEHHPRCRRATTRLASHRHCKLRDSAVPRGLSLSLLQQHSLQSPGTTWEKQSSADSRGLNPTLWVWLCPSATESARPQGCPLPGCRKSARSQWGHPSPPSNCPLARANARSKAGPLCGNASWKKTTSNKQPAACTLPACCLQKTHVPCAGTRATGGPFVGE